MTLVSIQLQRINDRSARFRKVREGLAAEVERATSLLKRQSESPQPFNEHNAWVAEVETWL